MQEIDMNKNIYFNEMNVGFDIGRLLKNIVSKLWVILLVGAIFASTAFVVEKVNYTEVYSSTMTLAFMEKTYAIVKDYTNDEDAQQQYKQETKFFSNSSTDTYRELLKGDEMISIIKSSLANDDVGEVYSESFIANSLNITSGNVASFFEISVTSEDKGYCERALPIVLEKFPGYVQSYDTTIVIKVVNRPSAPAVTNADSALQKAVFGFFVGAFLVIAVLFVITLATNTVLTLENLRRDINANVLGSIPLLERATGIFKQKKKTPQGSLLITDASKVSFSFVESFKSIRTKLENIKAEKGYKVFVVTSTYEDEGKTTVAVNIACSLAQKGKSVLLIDSDLRKPAILHAVGVKSDTNYGLIPIIKGTSTYVDSIKFIKSLGIFILPTGGVSLKSTEVLDTEKVKNVIEQARKEFDYIIIDSPPAHVVSDSLVISPLADGMIYTVRRDYARVNEINRTLEEIRAADIDVVGTIFSMSGGEENSRYYRKKVYGRYGRYGRYSRYNRYRRGNYGGGIGYGYSGYNGYNSYGNGYDYGGYGYGNSYGYGSGYGYGGYASQPKQDNNQKQDNE